MPKLCQFIFHRHGGSHSSIANQDYLKQRGEWWKNNESTSWQINGQTLIEWKQKTNDPTNEPTPEQTNRRTDGQAIKHAKRTVKMNEWGCWDVWDEIALRTQNLKFEPWGRIVVTIYGVPHRRFLEFPQIFPHLCFFPQVLFSLILRCGTHLSFR